MISNHEHTGSRPQRENGQRAQTTGGGENRSLQAEIKAILDETAERRRHLRKWRKNVDRIFNEMKKSGRKFPDSTAMIRRHRDG
jgi:hypothetical protein